MSHGFQSELRDAFDEPLRELRGTAQMMQDAVNEPVQRSKSPTGRWSAAQAGRAAGQTEAPGDQAPRGTSPDEQPATDRETQAAVEKRPAARGGHRLAQAGLMVSSQSSPSRHRRRASAREPGRRTDGRRPARELADRPGTTDAVAPQGAGAKVPLAVKNDNMTLAAAPGRAAHAADPLPSGRDPVRRADLRPLRPLDPGLPVPALPEVCAPTRTSAATGSPSSSPPSAASTPA